MPIMIGGGGETKTLRSVAKYADQWNVFGSPEILRHKDSVLRRHCEEVGRDHTEIERTTSGKIIIRRNESQAREALAGLMEHNKAPLSSIAEDETFWVGTADELIERMLAYREVGFHTFIAEMPAPYDRETMETIIETVKPAVVR